MNMKSVKQQAKQMDDFGESIFNKRPSPVPWEMGRQDVKILQAMVSNASTPSPETLN